MARMYSRKKGKSGSKKPIKATVPSWVRYKAKEIELLIAKLAKEGHSQSEIGMILRDSYGVPNQKVITGKKIAAILKEKKALGDIPEDLMNLIKKAVAIRKHLEANKGDETANRGLILTGSKIMRLVKYYKKTNKLSSEWKYNPKKAKMLID